jgi:hypothetical protein
MGYYTYIVVTETRRWSLVLLKIKGYDVVITVGSMMLTAPSLRCPPNLRRAEKSFVMVLTL